MKSKAAGPAKPPRKIVSGGVDGVSAREAAGLQRGGSVIVLMSRGHVIDVLRVHEQELRLAGVLSLSLFGSVARGENPAHDVDVAVRLGVDFSARGLDYFSRLDELEHRLSKILGCNVDVVEEPARKERLQQQIDSDRALAF